MRANNQNVRHSDAQRKFREALDRKKRNTKDGESHEDRASRVNQNGPIAQKRTFRRKTG